MKNYVLKVRLKDTDIWRTLAIPADCGFFDLHEAIQTAFGWADFYYHEFTAGGTTIADDANEDPDRVLPVDVMREFEKEGKIGKLHNIFYTTVGNGTAVASAKAFAAEYAQKLLQAGVHAVIMTST